jgi:phycoerythrobilin:ferredoxin oxidoreductase
MLVLTSHYLASICGRPPRTPPIFATATSTPEPTLYAPFLDRALALFDESSLDFHSYPLPDSLRRREGSSGSGARQQRVDLRVNAYRTEEHIRQARIAHIEGGSALQVLNFCIFPSLGYSLPSFAADLVTLPGGHLIALDWAPNTDIASDPTYAPNGPLADAFARHRQMLPDGGELPEAATKFFSPYFLWSRLPKGGDSDEVVSTRVLAAFEDYLRSYLQLVEAATPLEGAGTLRNVREAHMDYQTYRAESDPARPMLTRLFGEEYAEQLIREVLFDLPFRAEAGES